MGSRLTIDLSWSAAGVEGQVCPEGGGETGPFYGILELPKVLEDLGPARPDSSGAGRSVGDPSGAGPSVSGRPGTGPSGSGVTWSFPTRPPEAG